MRVDRRLYAAIVAFFVLFVAAPRAADDVVIVRASLQGGQETPAVVTGSFGNAVITLNRTTRQITYVVNIYNLSAPITAAHIHVGPKGVAAPTMIGFTVPTNSAGAFAMRGTLTEADFTPRPANGINTFEDAFFAIASGVTYFNAHTTANPGGEIRGQLCPDSAAANRFVGISTCGN